MKRNRKKNDSTKSSYIGVSGQSWLQMAQLQAEKCELAEAKQSFLEALKDAKRSADLKTMMEAISGLLRLSGEALDKGSIATWDQELDRLMSAYPKQTPPMAWYCKGAVARHGGKLMLAQRYFHRYLRAVRGSGLGRTMGRGGRGVPGGAVSMGTAVSRSEPIARGWIMLAIVLQQRGRHRRSLWLADEVLRRYEHLNLRRINGIVYLLKGTLFEQKRDFKTSMRWFQKAHAQFLGEHNWYYHLYALYGYARIARQQRNYSQAYWYLDLVDKAASTPEFGLLRREVSNERAKLQQDAVDLLIDSRKGYVKTREISQISLRKQYVLLHILEALSNAHRRPGKDMDRGLSKAEIIETVWKETYHSKEHDNRLYYNINRLRKLIEPDVRKPQYLLNWKEGYRLAPGLRIHCVGNSTVPTVDDSISDEGKTHES